jgi:hypothetical protein
LAWQWSPGVMGIYRQRWPELGVGLLEVAIDPSPVDLERFGVRRSVPGSGRRCARRDQKGRSYNVWVGRRAEAGARFQISVWVQNQFPSVSLKIMKIDKTDPNLKFKFKVDENR